MTVSPPLAAREYALGIAYLDGRYMPASQATVSVFDHSLLYGDGAFEIAVFGNRRFSAFEAHYDHLVDSCCSIKLELHEVHDSLLRIATGLVTTNNIDNGYVRIVVSRGEGTPLSDPRKALAPTIVMTIQSQPPNEKSDRGLGLIIASTCRISPDSLDPRATLNNRGNNIVARLEAIAADDVRDVRPAPLTPCDLYTAGEIFVTATGTGIAFVSEIHGRPIGDGKPGPVIAQLITACDRVLERCDNLFAGIGT